MLKKERAALVVQSGGRGDRDLLFPQLGTGFAAGCKSISNVPFWESRMVTESCEAIRVGMIAESRLIREALTAVLNQKTEMCIVASGCYSPEAIAAVADAGAQIVLLDADSFAAYGAQTIEAVHQQMPDGKVIMLGMQGDSETFIRAVRTGIGGYILRDASACDVAAAILLVASGEAVCPPKLCLLMFEYMARQGACMPDLFGKMEFGLTRREQQLVHMISRGLTNKEIAGELNLSDQTVKHHVHQILGKVGVPDRMTAVEVCRLHGMFA